MRAPAQDDVLIAGAGAIGQATGLALAQAGRRVPILESGSVRRRSGVRRAILTSGLRPAMACSASA
ncbi:hypothetical protein [Xanthomonas theicola]|uniref:Uncharacterized protein n=1 Tax=Xanthomonas theicola TaxID=56464 RepID=A0A2S6ZKY3_9XANT|nr:hypothetical protein [Xanthomonas theicola]PPT92942.1 hypothetical protein XthCFBP4691_01765 [Xanthomonas theicola]QNH23754.1 hypothetical protein G4Q83_01805 [Xanthomonas theicola]